MKMEMDKLQIKQSEIYRYLGYRGHEADEVTKHLVETCVAELQAMAEPKIVVREESLEVLSDGTLCIGGMQIGSKHLAKNLGECGQVLLMAATLGLHVDRLLNRYEKIQMSKAVIVQAAAAAMIESYCNEQCSVWKQEYEKKGLFLRPRYSPGYGDFSLKYQSEILERLDAAKTIGITLTDGGMMVPTKSVTAVIGISETDSICLVEGCENCGKKECLYRR